MKKIIVRLQNARKVGEVQMKCPCKGCADRTVTCHGVCRRYQEWKKELDETNKWLREQLPATSDAGLKGQRERLKRGKSRKWNLKNQYNRGES